MHRSGTSLLAGCLAECGLHLGRVRGSGKYNPSGYFELSSVQALHDQVLGLRLASWDRPNSSRAVHPHHLRMIAREAAQLAEKRPCGIKDPRLLLLLDAWLAVAPGPHALLGTFRHPLEVAQSLARRNGLSEQHSLDLWETYNAELVARHKASAFPLVHFDLSDHRHYSKAVEKMACGIGLDVVPWKIERFIRPNLVHHGAGRLQVPQVLRDLWGYLMECQC